MGHSLLLFSFAFMGASMAFPTEVLGEQALSDVLTNLANRDILGLSTRPIEVTGDHAFIPPNFEAGHQRGPCPGLNALANHGYISRDGVTSLVEVTSAISSVYGMGLDIALILSTMGTVFVGNPISLSPGFSIGSSDPGAQNLLNNVVGLLGTPRGLNGSHNIIESDGSGTRSDLYVTGDASTMDLEKFRALYDEFSGPEIDTFDIFKKSAARRFNESLMTNPNFYYGPWTGFIARNAGFLFSSRLFSNYSTENAQGVMTQDILKSFYGVEGHGTNLTYKVGHERIPENWYRMPNEYNLVAFNLDLLDLIAEYPELASIGGNTGTVDSFVGVDLTDVTGGILDATNLLQGNNLLCFTFEVVKTFSPSILSNILATIAAPLETLTNAIGSGLLDISCPAFDDMTLGGKPLLQGLQELFPGAALSGTAM